MGDDVISNSGRDHLPTGKAHRTQGVPLQLAISTTSPGLAKVEPVPWPALAPDKG
jgi:hypothetical protein